MRVFLDKSFCDDGVSFEKKIREVVVDTQMPKNRRNTALFIYYMSYLLSYSFCRLSVCLSLSVALSLTLSVSLLSSLYLSIYLAPYRRYLVSPGSETVFGLRCLGFFFCAELGGNARGAFSFSSATFATCSSSFSVIVSLRTHINFSKPKRLEILAFFCGRPRASMLKAPWRRSKTRRADFTESNAT